MEYRKLGKSDLKVSVLSLGTWAFGGDSWWGSQDDKQSIDTLYRAIELGINLIDTAPVYGRGYSEIIIGKALKKKKLRDKVFIATKAGLPWKGKSVFHSLKRESIFKEFINSLKRLNTDFIDLYQVHWPDPDTPIKETAQTLYKLYQKGKIKAIGVSNYSIPQMKEFLRYAPLHCLQPLYNMFRRDIEAEILPFCVQNNIGIITYSSLNSGILTGKFFFGTKIPKDRVRLENYDLKGKNFKINKEIVIKLKEIASRYNKTLAQLVLNWIISKKGITSSIVGARKVAQIEENTEAVNFKIDKKDKEKIEEILKEREAKIII